ncbi:MAG: hypothetical protein AAGF20_00775 [Pseudomonadota bacterium]
MSDDVSEALMSDEFRRFKARWTGFTDEVMRKFMVKERDGKTGWDKSGWELECKRQMMEHSAKGDPLDVALFAFFYWNMRGAGND